jgi:hypothetical protein
LLALLFAYPELREHALAVPPEHFLDSAYRAVFTLWKRVNTMEAVIESADEETADIVEQLRGRALPPADRATMIDDITQCVRRLHERYLRSLKSQERGVFASSANDPRADIKEVDRRKPEILESGDRLRKVFTEATFGSVRKNS